MSDAFLVRRGGSGGGLSPNSAVIHVTAPVGSTITFSKNGVIVKVLDASKSHVNADNNAFADWYYSISAANYGTWTITATLDTRSKSTTVSVSSNRQYDANISYDLYLIRDGNVEETLTLSGGTLTSGTTYAVFDTGGDYGRVAYYQTNVSGYSTLRIAINGGRNYSVLATTPAIGIAENAPGINSSTKEVTGYAEFTRFPTASSNGSVTSGTYDLDISSYNGTQYIYLASGGSSNYNGVLNIYDFYLF